jgi:hypothetical protein
MKYVILLLLQQHRDRYGGWRFRLWDEGTYGHPGGTKDSPSREGKHAQHRKGAPVKRGHCTGTKREKKGASDWYKAIEQANIDRITKEWTAKQQTQTEGK